MAKKFGYSPVSIFAAACGTVASAAVMANPVVAVPAATAAGIGAAASAVAGGIELNEEEKNIKDKLDSAMDKAWNEIEKRYRLYDSEDCLSELKREIMGEGTSVEEFVRNKETKGFKPSITMVTRSILEKHRELLSRDPEIIWDDRYTEDAANDMA